MTTSDPRWRSFEDYATARWAALYRTAHLISGDPAVAEDLLQTTMLKVMAQWSRVRRADSPDAYVRKMLLNELLGERRKTGRRAQKAHLVPVPSPVTDPAADTTTRLDLWDRRGSGPCSSCATTRTSPRRRSPASSASPPGR